MKPKLKRQHINRAAFGCLVLFALFMLCVMATVPLLR